jgi:hypothetical protein
LVLLLIFTSNFLAFMFWLMRIYAITR